MYVVGNRDTQWKRPAGCPCFPRAEIGPVGNTRARLRPSARPPCFPLLPATSLLALPGAHGTISAPGDLISSLPGAKTGLFAPGRHLPTIPGQWNLSSLVQPSGEGLAKAQPQQGPSERPRFPRSGKRGWKPSQVLPGRQTRQTSQTRQTRQTEQTIRTGKAAFHICSICFRNHAIRSFRPGNFCKNPRLCLTS